MGSAGADFDVSTGFVDKIAQSGMAVVGVVQSVTVTLVGIFVIVVSLDGVFSFIADVVAFSVVGVVALGFTFSMVGVVVLVFVGFSSHNCTFNHSLSESDTNTCLP